MEPEPETKEQRIRRVAREWYRKNKERIRQKKLDQCHAYRRRLRVGRPSRIQTHPERVMSFNTQTQELTTFVPEHEPTPERQSIPEPEVKRKPEPKPEPEPEVSVPRTIERGSFLVSF